MSLTLKFYTHMKYDENNMCKFFSEFFINFVSLYVQCYVYRIRYLCEKYPYSDILLH
jgi:hypothetical protein